MVTALLALLGRLNLKTILVGLVLAAIVGAGIYGYVRITTLEAHVSKIESDNKTLQTQISSLQLVVSQKEAALTECSKATEQARAMADEIAQKASAAQALAKKEAQTRYSQARQILKTMPKPGQSSCDATNEFLNGLIPTRSMK